MMTPYEYMQIADQAYDLTPDIGTHDLACAVVRNTADGLVIAFSGTDSVQDLITDFDVEPNPYLAMGRIHAGFLNYWREIRNDVWKAAEGQAVTFAGHSLGAALAVIAAADFVCMSRVVRGVYGFEPPRVSPDPLVGKLLTLTPMYLCRNGEDIVTDLPPDWPQAGRKPARSSASDRRNIRSRTWPTICVRRCWAHWRRCIRPR